MIRIPPGTSPRFQPPRSTSHRQTVVDREPQPPPRRLPGVFPGCRERVFRSCRGRSGMSRCPGSPGSVSVPTRSRCRAIEGRSGLQGGGRDDTTQGSCNPCPGTDPMPRQRQQARIRATACHEDRTFSRQVRLYAHWARAHLTAMPPWACAPGSEDECRHFKASLFPGATSPIGMRLPRLNRREGMSKASQLLFAFPAS